MRKPGFERIADILSAARAGYRDAAAAEEDAMIIDLEKAADGSFTHEKASRFKAFFTRKAKANRSYWQERFPVAYLIRELMRGRTLSTKSIKQTVNLVLLGRALLAFRRFGLRGAGGVPLTALSIVVDIWMTQRAMKEDAKEKETRKAQKKSKFAAAKQKLRDVFNSPSRAQ